MQLLTVAQITPDASLGTESSLLTGNGITGGARRGANLFHSFEQFNVGNEQSVYFVSDFGVRNIISRVTGTSPSVINGTLGVSDFASNLFLINPNGIVMGSGANLDIAGSFVSTTANAIRFGNKGTFSASNPIAPPLLTIDPSALLFTQQTPAAPITIQNTYLAMSPGTSLLMIGGKVSLDRVEIWAPGTQIELGGLKAPGTVALSLSDDSFGNLIHAHFPAGVERSDLSIFRSPIFVGILNENLNLGGNIALTAHNIEVLGDIDQTRSFLISGIANLVQPVAGRGGNIVFDATGNTTIANSFVGSSVQYRAIGNGGNIEITTGSLFLKEGGSLSSSSAGVGLGGNVTIQAKDVVQVDGQYYQGVSSSIASNLYGSLPAVADAGVGQGGDISITTRSMQLINGGTIAADIAYGAQGRAGNVTIVADAIEIDGSTQVDFSPGRVASGIVTSLSNEAIGRGGDISITSRTFSLANGGVLKASSAAQGNAGNITLNSQVAKLDGRDSGIFSSVDAGAIGAGGNINLRADTLVVSNRARISADSQGTGIGGNIQIQADALRLDRSAISAETQSSQGGNITLTTPGLLLLRRGSSISTTAGIAQTNGDGGNINLTAGFVVAVPNENSDISANAFRGNGGNIAITAQNIFGIDFRDRQTESSDITASSQFGINGSVTLNQLALDPIQGTSELPTRFSSPPVAQGCQASSRTSRFVNQGRGGVSTSPADPLVAETIWQDWELIDQPQAKHNPEIVEAQGWVKQSDGTVALVHCSS